MRRIGDLMKDMGFNADAPIETQKAFIRHLIAQANGGVAAPSVADLPAAKPVPNGASNQPSKIEPSEAQLSFDKEILGFQPRIKFGGR